MSAAVSRPRRSRRFRDFVGILLTVPVLLALVACSTEAPPTASKPTAAEEADNTSSDNTSSPAKPAASPGASPGASPSPSPEAASLISIADATLADATPWVSLRLADGEPVIVSGWRLEVGDQSVIVPGNAILQPGGTLVLRAGDGMSSETEIFLGPESHALALAASPGTQVRLVDPTGVVMAETTVPRY